MPHILLVTNDFPPTIGGIQSYLRDFLNTLDPKDVVVFASTQDKDLAAEFDSSVAYEVIRWPKKVMLPTPKTAREVQRIVTAYGIDVVWFGAAAPLALMGRAAKKAGASRVIATTHGHEVGWSMLPGARAALRAIGRHADYVTYISDYTLGRLKNAFGLNPQWVHLPSAVSLDLYSPAGDKEKEKAKQYFGLDSQRPVVVCISRFVPRKGQDQLLRAMAEIDERQAQLLLVGRGRYESALRELAKIYFPAAVFHEASGPEEISLALGAADVFAMPARTRGKGLDVEGLGIVYLEAQAAGVPVIAGNSGGAPETVTSKSGIVVNGADRTELVAALNKLLGSKELRQKMGSAGRRAVEEKWTWEIMGERLRAITATMRGTGG